MPKPIIKILLSSCVAVETILLLCGAGCSKGQEETSRNLIGCLVMDGCGDVKSCSFFENGKKRELEQIYLHLLFDNYKESTGWPGELGDDSFGHGFGVEIELNNGNKYNTMVLYEPVKHVISLQVNRGLFDDPFILSTKLVNLSQIEMAEKLFEIRPTKEALKGSLKSDPQLRLRQLAGQPFK